MNIDFFFLSVQYLLVDMVIMITQFPLVNAVDGLRRLTL
ncbi:hypothetical protein seszw40S_add [Salmonella phage seszw]|nr:hypothetical protein seszw40S_add [Salmonella phage seszw]QZB86612.1 hypothetical protein seszw60S_add [Salmonella phage seszw]